MWLIEAGAAYALVLYFGGRRCRSSRLVWAVTAAWLVVMVSYLPWAYTMCGRILDGWWPRSGASMYWTLGNPFATVLVVPLAALCVLRGWEAIGALLLVLLASSWVSWEILGTQLAILGMSGWDEAGLIQKLRFTSVFLLSGLTLLVLGSYGLWNVIGVEERHA